MGNGTAVMVDDGSMMSFHTHCSEIRAHNIKGVNPCPFLWFGRSNGCFFIGSAALVSCLLDLCCQVQSSLSTGVKRGTIRFIPELVHNLASALALRAPLTTGCVCMI